MKLHPEAAKEYARARQGVRSLVDGVACDDPELFVAGLELVARYGFLNNGWRRAVTRIAAGPPVSWRLRRHFRQLWLQAGDSIRCEFSHDHDLIDFLRLLLPPYQGMDKRLWRGEGWLNRCHRTYGLSWSDHQDTARSFAESNARYYRGGGVLLEADVPGAAIVCGPISPEREFIVDRRLLGTVRALERYPQQIPP
jgi:hypothetical protein